MARLPRAMGVRRTLAPTVAACAVLLAGCSGSGEPGDQPGAEAGATRSAPGASGSVTRAPTGPAPPTPAASGGGPPTPAPTSGPLGENDVPRPGDLGTRWRQFADPGGPEKGFRGNGEFVRARDPAEVVRSVVPLGCPSVDEAPRLPRPEHALEATYRSTDGDPAVALVLQYPGPAQAVDALDAFAAMVATCAPPAQPPEQTRPVITTLRADERAVWDVRRSAGPGATGRRTDELAVREADRVGLLVRPRGRGEPRADFPQLTRALRGTLRESRR